MSTLQQDFELAQRLRQAERDWPEAERQQKVDAQRLQLETDMANAKIALKDVADLRMASWQRFETLLTGALRISESVVRAWESYQSADSQVSAHAGRVAQLELSLNGTTPEPGNQGSMLVLRAEHAMARDRALEQAGVQPLVYRLPVGIPEAALGLVDALQVPIRPAAQPQPPINWAQFEEGQLKLPLDDPSVFENKAAEREDAELKRYQQWEANQRRQQS